MNSKLKNNYKNLLEKNILESAIPPGFSRGKRNWFSIPRNIITTYFRNKYQQAPYWQILAQGEGGGLLTKTFPKHFTFPQWMIENSDTILSWYLQLDGRILIKIKGGTWHYLENTPNGPRPGPPLNAPPDWQPGINQPPGDPVVNPGVKPPWQPFVVVPAVTIPYYFTPNDASADPYGTFPGNVQPPNAPLPQLPPNLLPINPYDPQLNPGLFGG